MGIALSTNKILFITPPCHCGVAEIAGRWLPLHFVYLAGAARAAGFESEIYDAMTKDHGYSEIEQRLRLSGASYVATSAITSTIIDAVKTLEVAKRLNPHVVTIIGGVHPTFCYEEVLNGSEAVDFVVLGEGESSLVELLTALECGGDPAVVSGLAFRRDGAIVTTGRRPFPESMDDLPMAWDLLEWEEYKYFIIPDSRLGAISTSRGCDCDCTCCSQEEFWEKHWRSRSPHTVAAEIACLYESYGVNVFLLADETPTRDRKRWEQLLDLLIERNLPIYLLMRTRTRDVLRDRDIIWKYRRAGVIHISICIGSADLTLSESSTKEPAVPEGKLALDIIHDQGIVSEASFDLGFPDETPDSVERTLKLAQYCNPDNAHFLAVTPWPYAGLYDDYKPFVRVHDYTKYTTMDPVIEPKRMSLFQMDVAIVDCYRRFYMGKLIEVATMKDDFKRDYLMKSMKLFMSSSFIIRKLGMGTLGKVPAKIEEMIGKMNRV